MRRLHRIVLRLYPRQVRARYGPELLAMLDASTRPWRDLLDIARNAVRDRTEVLLVKHLRSAAAILAAVSLFALGYAVNGLQDGLTELPRHWWSVAPIGVLLVAGLMWLVPAARRRRPVAGPEQHR